MTSQQFRDSLLERLRLPERQMVIALGGNAISLDGEEGNIDQQFWHSRDTARLLAPLVRSKHRVTLTHGNGPQVGSILRRVELASNEVYPISLCLAVADTQAGMGYMLGQCLENELIAQNDERRVYTLVTSTIVDPADPDFQNPSKPIGSWLDEETAKKNEKERGWIVRELKPGRWRRVVPSPEPIEVLESSLIKRLANDGETVIACGGGGVPVQRDPQTRRLEGVDAVIDKDKASSLLALTLEADLFLILTAVDRVCVNFEKPGQREIAFATPDELRGYLEAGEFPRGSMGPKVEAVCRFVERSKKPGALALITSIARVGDALKGETGTIVHMPEGA